MCVAAYLEALVISGSCLMDSLLLPAHSALSSCPNLVPRIRGQRSETHFPPRCHSKAARYAEEHDNNAVTEDLNAV
jgi:hypothetical protein